MSSCLGGLQRRNRGGELGMVTKGQYRDLGGFEGLFSTLTMVTDS